MLFLSTVIGSFFDELLLVLFWRTVIGAFLTHYFWYILVLLLLGLVVIFSTHVFACFQPAVVLYDYKHTCPAEFCALRSFRTPFRNPEGFYQFIPVSVPFKSLAPKKEDVKLLSTFAENYNASRYLVRER